jgi:hypothetical protein
MGSEWMLGRLAEGRGVKWILLAQDRIWCWDLANSDEPSGSADIELVS